MLQSIVNPIALRMAKTPYGQNSMEFGVLSVIGFNHSSPISLEFLMSYRSHLQILFAGKLYEEVLHCERASQVFSKQKT